MQEKETKEKETETPEVQESKKSKEKADAPISEEKRQKKLKRRKKLKYGSLATAVSVIFIAVVVLVNVIVAQLGKRYPDMELDLTTTNLYEISDETLDYIQNLNKDVEIAVSADESNFQTGTYNKMISETIDRYAGYSDHIKVTYFDTTKDPDVLAKYQDMYSGTIDSNEIIVTSGDRIKVYSINDMFEIDEDNYYYYYYGYMDYEDLITGFKGEQVLTTAIMNVTDSNPKTVGLIMTSNGDYIFSATQANYYAMTQTESLLDSNGYDVEEIDMINTDFDPEDYDILLLPAPASDLTTDAVAKLTDFLYNDGNLGKQLIYIADYTQASTPNLDAFLKEWNITIDSSYVVDENSSTNQAVNIVISSGRSISAPIVTVTDEEDYTGNLSNTSLPIVAPIARPITELTANNGRVVYSLLTTADTSYRYPLTLKSSTDSEDALTEDTTEAATEEESAETTTTTFDTSTAEYGANTVMALCQDQQSTGSELIESDILVLGSMSMLDYNLLQDSAYNNAEYFVGVLNSICGKEDSIVIAAKDLSQTTISATDTQLKAIRTVVVFVIPLVVVVIGVIVALRRKWK